MQEINLLQNRLKDTTYAWENQSRWILVLLTVVLIVLIAAAGLLFFLNRNLQNESVTLTSQNQALQSKLTSQQSNLGSAQALQAQLTNIQTLINNHTYITPFLNELSRVTYIKTQYDTLDINQTGQINIEGNVSSYSDLGKMLLGLSTSTEFQNVQLLSVLPATGKTNSYEYSVNLSALPAIFTKK